MQQQALFHFFHSVLITTSFYTGGSCNLLGTPEGWAQVPALHLEQTDFMFLSF